MRNNKIQAKNEQYLGKYDNLNRWINYWIQIESVLELEGKQVLEVGIGNRTVGDYLTKRDIFYISSDINHELGPNVKSDIKNLPFKNNTFDVVLCAEVLEHLPFEEVPVALEEIKRTALRYVVVSLPHESYNYFINFEIPFFGFFKHISLPYLRPYEHKFDGEHYWEIGKRDYPLKKVRDLFEKSGLKIVKERHHFMDSYHHFFILEKA